MLFPLAILIDNLMCFARGRALLCNQLPDLGTHKLAITSREHGKMRQGTVDSILGLDFRP